MKFNEIHGIVKEQIDVISGHENPDFRLEQSEYQAKEKIWELIISYLVENKSTNNSTMSLISGQHAPLERVYKRVKINDKKEVIGFFIYPDK